MNFAAPAMLFDPLCPDVPAAPLPLPQDVAFIGVNVAHRFLSALPTLVRILAARRIQGSFVKSAVRQDGAGLFARKHGVGHRFAEDGHALAKAVLRAITRRSADAVLETVFTEDGYGSG